MWSRLLRLGMVMVLALLAVGVIAPTDAYAGSGSTTTLGFPFSFRTSYGSSESGSNSYINYVYAEVTAPGVRSAAYVYPVVSIYSEGRLVYTQQVSVSFGAGVSGQTKGVYVYLPSYYSRAQVRRGQNQIKVEYKYVQLWWSLNTDQGVATTTFTVP